MDHVKNILKIVSIFFWGAYYALIWTVLHASENLPALGVGSFIFYAFVLSVVTYVAVVLTYKLWSTE